MASAAILAGGRASRFDGRDKSARVVGGRSIFERQLEELSRIVPSEELDLFGNRHRLLANVNTPVEYEEIEALAGHER